MAKKKKEKVKAKKAAAKAGKGKAPANTQLSLQSAGGKNVVRIDIEEEMRTSYINYAMSVIVGRALPDVRDGLKPVHRRIMFSMYEQGMFHSKPFKKSARVVGDVLGKYHPHGDSAIYDSLVRMAQDFAMRYPLIDGQGNFGSIDGDNAAAMRYTEARLEKISEEVLADLDKETVEFMPNFDDSLKEPTVLPSKIPGLLLNGSSGIAVGMATNIPPHNLGELADAIIALVDNPDLEIKKLLSIVKGPDFPTGATITGTQGIKDAYAKGKGSIAMQATAAIEPVPGKKDRECIIVNEIPYQVNKSNLIINIADLVRDKKIPGIADLRDESGKEGLRIYIEVKRGVPAQLVLKQLYKHTALRTTFGFNMLAIVDGEPKVLTLKDALTEYINFRVEIVTKRAQFELRKAKERAHILEGLRIALKNIDAVIKLIKASKTVQDAKSGLMKKFKLSEIQAQAILDMRLQKLAALEVQKVEAEYKELKKKIEDLEDVLKKKKRVFDIIKTETAEVKEKYADPRRTMITGEAKETTMEDLIPDNEVVVFLSKQGFAKRIPVQTFRSQLRGGRGVAGMETTDDDRIDQIFVTSTHSYLMLFTDRGKAYRIKVYEIPDASRASKGQNIKNFVTLTDGEVVTAAMDIKDFKKDSGFLLMATEQGVVKKIDVSEFENIRKSGVIAINIDSGDRLRWVSKVSVGEEVVCGTLKGMMIRFKEKDVRPMGRNARGVRGINLKKDDKLISMDVISDAKKAECLIISSLGYGKRTVVNEYRSQSRGGKGVKAMGLRDKKGDVVASFCIVTPEDEIMLVTKNGIVSKQKVKKISLQKRAAKGVTVQRLDKEDKIVDVAKIDKTAEEVAQKA
ncbi:DNA gyrase subunit A [Candidatus Margulisiibacteriota bacterium]